MQQEPVFNTGTALLGGGSLCAALVPAIGFAESEALPAVANVNGKISFGLATAGENTDTGEFYLNGALSFPISTRLGAQLDLGGTQDTLGAGLHLFLRDPNSYLIGVYAHRVESDTSVGIVENLRYGVEAEGYFGDLTVAAFIGQDEVGGAVDKETFSVVELDFDYYLDENTVLSLSGTSAFEEQSAAIGLSHLYDAGDTSFAVSASLGMYEGEATASLGVTFLFGNDGMSLKQVHRQNDPRIRLSPSPTRSGYFDALKAGDITNTPGPVTACPKYCL